MKAATQIRIPPDAPYFDGHFPGRPLVPAVVILDLVRDCLAASAGDSVLRAPLAFAKFVAPLLPGELLTIEVEHSNGAHTFSCSAGARRVAFGAFGRRGP
jgi:3-hydroxymyristoyl/3-hydroxydecanoyl-(acyl carrier protein) dehydratase